MIARLADSLVEERDALFALAPLRLLLWLGVVAAAVWLLATGVPFAVRIAWKLGVDPRRRLFLASSLARLLAPVVTLLGLAVPFSGRAPTLGALALLALVVLLVAVSPSFARNLAAGIGLALRARPRPGDQIQIGELEGTVIAVGSTRVRLRARGGSVIYVPAADFERLPVTIGKQRATVPVELDLRTPVPLDEAALQRMRRALWFSPFRRAGTAVRLAGDLADLRVHVVMDTWAPDASAELQRHVGALVRRSISPASTAVDGAAVEGAASERAPAQAPLGASKEGGP